MELGHPNLTLGYPKNNKLGYPKQPFNQGVLNGCTVVAGNTNKYTEHDHDDHDHHYIN